ncbi:MAG: hypothetical protein DMG05_28965 [Acidobacteria bacterium]|nr:MAG: hypothetical protein DMG05_28965 [Acidobacteriota bacterium]
MESVPSHDLLCNWLRTHWKPNLVQKKPIVFGSNLLNVGSLAMQEQNYYIPANKALSSRILPRSLSSGLAAPIGLGARRARTSKIVRDATPRGSAGLRKSYRFPKAI